MARPLKEDYSDVLDPKVREDMIRRRDRMRARRAAAKAAGATIPSNEWWKANRDKHRANVAQWRLANSDHARAVTRAGQARRRSTPWGRINNRIWTVMHGGVRVNSDRCGKYARALGYTWATLRAHLEAQFLPGMSWDNWGAVWELDHIRPVCLFQYASLDDPLFREAWRLDNLRPLWREANAAKGRSAA